MAKFIIEGGSPINGEVTPSGNKNEALPALMACLLTDEDIVLKRVPKINDVLTVCQIIEELGGETEWLSDDTLRMNAKNIDSYKPNGELCTHVRASILFLGPLLARFGKVELPLPGGDVIGARRMDTHFEGIQAFGGEVTFGNPIVAQLPKLGGSEVYFDEPSVTATENILLLAALSNGKTTLHNAACEPHIVGLCNLLNQMGAKISGLGSNKLRIEGVNKLHGTEFTIGPDFMEIGSFIALGSIGKGTVTINDIVPDDLRFVLKTFQKLGISPTVSGNKIIVDGTKEHTIQKDISGRVSCIYSGPWPAYPTDLMSVAIVAATQCNGTILFHEKMFEGRMFFTDKLMSMGANIVLCDPHRVVINGPAPLSAARMSSPDVRAGMALVMAAAIAQGTSEIDNIYQIERGYFHIERKLESLGIKIKRVPQI